MRIIAQRALVAFLVLLLVACAFAFGRPLFARLKYDFLALPENEQVLYETGAEDLARLAATELAGSMQVVENLQYTRFKDRKAIRIYVFNNRNHYANFSNAPAVTWGASTTDELYLSQKLRERPQILPSILVHELSHVHVRQYLGTFRYIKDVPGWFLEGLAVLVSSGGGAGDVTVEQARASIRNGVHFEPDDAGRLIGPKTAHSYELEPRMYYRQAALFVEYLREVNPEAFKATLFQIENGTSFREVWRHNYGHTIFELWQNFKKSIAA